MFACPPPPGGGRRGRHVVKFNDPFHSLRNRCIFGVLHDALGITLLRDDLDDLLAVCLRLGVSALGTLARRGRLSPWRVVLLLVPLLPGPGGKLVAPWSAILSVHLAARAVQRCCQPSGRSW